QTIDAFEREARVLAQLDHPAIPRLTTSFREGAGIHLRLYLAQELVEGEPLSVRVRRGPMAEQEVRDLARQALDVLAYLHERRVLEQMTALRREDRPASSAAALAALDAPPSPPPRLRWRDRWRAFWLRASRPVIPAWPAPVRLPRVPRDRIHL